MQELSMDRVREAAAYAGQWLQYQQIWRDLPGLAVSIRAGEELVLSAVYGFANVERRVALSAHHVFRVASHSKTFTATAIMQLVERGSVHLDDPIARYLEALPPGHWVGTRTVRQLLNHVSGIIRDGSDTDFWQLCRPFPDLPALIAVLDESAEVLPANEAFKYSNIGYSLLGAVIEGAAGTSYTEYVRREIVERLELRATGPETDDRARARLVTGYTRPILDLPRRPVADVPTGAMAAATGFYSNADDLTQYAMAHCFGNDTLITDGSKREMQGASWEVEQSEGRYGLGLALVDVDARRTIGHGGSFPGHATRTMVDPRARIAVSVCINQTGGPALLLAGGVFHLINAALEAAEPRHAGALERYLGRYVSQWGASDVVAFGDRLLLLNPDADNPMRYPTELSMVESDLLLIGETDGYGSRGEFVRYERDAAGAVIRVVIAGTSCYPEAEFRRRRLDGLS